MAVTVNIRTRTPEGRPSECVSNPNPFRANPGEAVTFEFPEFPNADIVFNGRSPFRSARIKPGMHKVRDDVEKPTPPAKTVKYDYKVTWGDGTGGGTGEVPPG
jgi:hypothetical protein